MIDSHCHLSYPDFNADRDAMIQRARDAGVEAFVTIATGPEDWHRCLDLAEGRAGMRVALGIHPNEASCFSDKLIGEMRALAKSDARVVAIGETGLDFFRDHCPRDKQYAAFDAQLALAEELKKPFILHCRAAEREMLELLEKNRAATGHALNGIWHCFTSTKEFARRAADLNLYFGLGGVVTYPKSNEVREALALMPEERLLLETDCPFLPPQPWRGKRNEPAYLTAVVQKIAEVRGISEEAVRASTTANAKRVFSM
ncbi:MAG TPA: TatD family hydrolase [Planctomycetota bacterium]|nr:TatD family hydrolase [Planctomycetota bacterium]